MSREDVLVEALGELAGQLERMSSNPMKSWDAGLCVDAIRVEEVAAEIREAIVAYRAQGSNET